MKKFAFLFLFALILAGCSRQTGDSTSQEAEGSSPLENTTEFVVEDDSIVDFRQFTLASVAEHASKEDCWMVIEGKVLDVSEYIASAKHPGKDAIVAGCGKDATEFFNKRASDGQPHSQFARELSEKFVIGTLAEEGIE